MVECRPTSPQRCLSPNPQDLCVSCVIQLKELQVELGFQIHSLQNRSIFLIPWGSCCPQMVSFLLLSLWYWGLNLGLCLCQVNVPQLPYIPSTAGLLLSFINGVA